MADRKEQAGECLCGKVRFRVTEPTDDVAVCHCGMCRRWSGGPALVIDCEKGVEFEGEDNIVTYRSSDWAERAFCGTCGTNLFYRIVETGQTFLCAGALDDQAGLTMTSQIFIDEKPDFYEFANATENMTGAEVFALYAPPEAKG